MAIYLAFVGCNATTGTPNPRTGKMSKFGWFYRFKTRKDRDSFIENYSHNNYTAVACGFNSGRKFDLGNSLANYSEHILALPYYCKDDNALSIMV